jgi:16S rRNA U516 pseudouridylate synthase RsuA-like enzyme
MKSEQRLELKRLRKNTKQKTVTRRRTLKQLAAEGAGGAEGAVAAVVAVEVKQQHRIYCVQENTKTQGQWCFELNKAR